MAYEDVDFAYRAKLAGANFLFVREAQACHPWRSVRQGGKNWKAKNYESADFVRFIKKHNPSEPEFSFYGHFRNLCRMATTDLVTCIWEYRMRGLDILFFKCSSPSKVCLTFSFTKKGEVKLSRDLEFKSNFK